MRTLLRHREGDEAGDLADASTRDDDESRRPSAIARGAQSLRRAQVREAPAGPGEGMAAGKSFLDEALADSPWRIGDLYRLGTRMAIGLIGLLVAWAGASTTTTFTTQVIWIGVAVGLVVVTIAGAVGWLVSGMGAVAAERRAIRTDIRSRWEGPTPEVTDHQEPTGLVVGEGMRRYHRASCDVVAGKPVTPVTQDEAEQRGFVSCGMCQS